ncbi:MAG: helix-turn-helix domain-containing protein [Gemmatimonadales bacterium]
MKPLLILVLDGDPERRQSWMTLLRECDHEAAAEIDLDVAAEAIVSGRYGVLVLDLTLPQLDRGALGRALSSDKPPEPESLEEVERRHVALMLRHTAGNRRKAAHLLGISRSTLLNKVRKYGLDS